MQQQFVWGDFDSLKAQTREVSTFSNAASEPSQGHIPPAELRRLLLEAARSHAKLVALSTRCRGWQRHVMALREVMQDGEELPVLYRDPVYLRTKERKVLTSFGDSGYLELCWVDP
jgi:hypothetical protein